MKFSIIMPVYNLEKYLNKSLESIQNQSYENFEVIIVNDGSKDSSQSIIEEFEKRDKRFKSYIKENGGVASARNYGLKHVTGDYIVFVDGDDYINNDLLQTLKDSIGDEKPDIIRYSPTIVHPDNTLEDIYIEPYVGLKEKAIDIILKNKMVDVLWLYTYNVEFFKKNKFKFPNGKDHEDFDVLVSVFSKAKTIKIIDYIGYNYVLTSNSLMRNNDYNKAKQKAKDLLFHHLRHQKELSNNYSDLMLLNFSASVAILKGKELNDEDLNEYISELKKYNVLDDIYTNTIKRKIKKIYLKLFLKKYILSLRNKR